MGSERHDDALEVARQAESSSPELEHAARLVAHILRDQAIDEHGRGDPSWRSHLALHLEALERVYGLDPGPQEVQAALEAADLLDDEEASRRWLARLETQLSGST